MAIVQRISLEGGQAVVRELEAVGKGGQRALQSINDASSRLNLDRLRDGFKSVGDTARNAFETLINAGGRLSGVFGVALAGGVTGVASAMGVLSKSAVEAVDAMDDLADASGTTVTRMNAILSVFRQTGTGADTVTEKMRRLTVSTQKAWEDIKTSVADADKTYRQNQLNVEGTTLALEQANLNLAKSYKAVSSAAGDPVKTEQALLDVRQNQLAVSRAELAQQEARDKARKDEMNSVENLRAAVLGLARGTGDLSNINVTAENVFKGIVAAAGPSVEALKDLDGGFTSIAARSGPAATDVLFLLADVFKNLDDATLKTAIAAQAFGRNVDQDLIKALSRGSEAFRKREKELEDLGLAFGEADAKAADAFQDTFRNLGDLLALTKDKIGITLAPLFTTLGEALTGLLTQNIGTLKEAAEGIKDALQPVFQGLANVVKGVNFDDFKKEAKDAFSAEQYIRIEDWQRRFLVIKEGALVVIAAFRGIRDVVLAILGEIAAAINKVFGTQISAEGLGIALIIARFSGLLGIITQVIVVVGRLGAAISALATSPAALLNPWVLLAVAIGALLLVIVNHWDQIKAAGGAAADAIRQAWSGLTGWFSKLLADMGKLWSDFTTFVQDKWNAVVTWFQGIVATLAGYWTAFTDGIRDLIDAAVNYVKQAWGGLASWFNGIVDSMRQAWADFVSWVKSTAAAISKQAQAVQNQLSQSGGQGQPAGFAGGGLIRGPGTSTSDSIPARLSAGEFVVRAAAVRHVGVGFMRSLNAAPAYALGGLVDAIRDGLGSLAVPMARGGPAPSQGQLRPFNLVMPGGASYGGLFAQTSAVNTLRRAAVGAQIASAGRRPSWVR